MQRQRSTRMLHSSLAMAHTSEAAVVGGTGRNYCSNPTAQSYNQRSLTHRLHAHELQRGSSSKFSVWVSGCGAPPCPALGGHGSSGGPARGSALEVAQPGLLPRVPLHVVFVQWAAKVAFFKLKLDQLMDSLCRVCLAESKQNLQRQEADEGGSPHPGWGLANLVSPNLARNSLEVGVSQGVGSEAQDSLLALENGRQGPHFQDTDHMACVVSGAFCFPPHAPGTTRVPSESSWLHMGEGRGSTVKGYRPPSASSREGAHWLI